MVILNAIFAIFTGVGDWIIGSLNDLMTLFWLPGAEGAAGELTFMGVLAVAGLAFSVIFLLIGIIQRFLHFRG